MATTALQTESTLGRLIASNMKQIESVLPKHMTAQRIARVALVEARRNPRLMECEPLSFIGALMQAAQVGLEPGGSLGHSYLVPFHNRKTGTQEVQFIIGYKGLMDLARRSGMVSTFDAQVVREHDWFEYEYGTNQKLRHIPHYDDRGDPRHVYAIAGLKDGGFQFVVMSIAEIEAIRARSKSPNSGPWQTDWEAMAKKSCIRALADYLPMSNEFAEAISVDREAERGEQTSGALMTTFVVEPEPVESKPEQKLRERAASSVLFENTEKP